MIGRRRARPLDVAIIGMGCRFPGSKDLAAFWETILRNRPAIREVPVERWDPSIFHDPGAADCDRVAGRHGGYLDEVLSFDPATLGIMPRTIEGAEPEQFLILEAALAALADAGLKDGPADGRRVEVVIGRGNYFNRGNLTRLQHGRVLAQTLAILKTLHPEWSPAEIEAVRADLRAKLPPFEAATIPGQLTNATAGRIAHRLNLRGASYVVDAASASSLVALDLGARALVEGRADLVLVGGVYIEADVDFPLVFSRLGVLSRSGRPRPFEADADGLVPGEGVGMVVLKRLAEAERAGDRIYAVLKGVGVASDGRGPSLAAPDARGHLRAMNRAYRRSGVDPATVGLIEGHGLGVPAADRAELRALRRQFAGARRCTLGAVSSLIGHAMPAAGMAGLIKSALALHHRILPASPEIVRPHPVLAREGCPLVLTPVARPWIQGQPSPRRAGVNAFGFAGINAHAVLEEHGPSADRMVPSVMDRWPDEAVLLAAPDRATLRDRCRALATKLRNHPAIELKDLAFTLNREASRSPFRVRLGLVVPSVSALADRLEAVARRLEDSSCQVIRDGRGTYFWDGPLGGPEPGRLAFLFPGEGSQYPGMFADLCFHFPMVRAEFDIAERLACESGLVEAPSDRLFEPRPSGEGSIWRLGSAVHAVLASQWAMFQLLGRLGLRPDAVVGHSSGEFLALVAAGAVREDRRLELCLMRMGSLFRDLESSGRLPEARLVSVAAGRERVEQLVRGQPGSVAIAIDNCPHQVILVGGAAEIASSLERLRGEGIPCEDLPFSRAYHSAAFEPALGPIRAFFEALEFGSPAIPIYSCCSGRRFEPEPNAIRELAVAQWTRTVEFRRTIEQMHHDGLRIFVDVGARGNLAGFVEDTLRERPAFALAANLPRRSGLTQLNQLVAALFAQGLSIDPSVLYARRCPVSVDLDAVEGPMKATFPLRFGFPEMSLSPSLAERLRRARDDSNPAEPRHARNGGLHPAPQGALNGSGREPAPHSPAGRERAVPRTTAPRSGPVAAGDAPLLAFHETMRSFLEVEQAVLHRYLARSGEQVPDPRKADPAAIPVHSNGHGNGRRPGPARQGLRPSPVDEPAAGTRDEGSGDWSGVVLDQDPGRSILVAIRLDSEGDPVAEHHTFGGRRISRLDPSRKGLPVLPFTIMAEMLAQVAQRLAPGQVLVGLHHVRARRWIRYEDDPIRLEIRAEILPDQPGQIRAALWNRGRAREPQTRDDKPDVEGIVVFGPARPEPGLAGPWEIGPSQPTRFTAESLYGEQWLFHGPALQAVVGVGNASPQGIEGTLRVLPRRAILRDPFGRPPLTDPIVLDAFTHLLGCWGLDQLAQGDVIFPLMLGELRIFGADPPEGAEVSCRIAVRAVDRHRVHVDAEIIRDDGRVWMRIGRWEDWRFYWPARYRDGFRQPDRVLLGEPLSLPGGHLAVWLQPPADMARPVWRDVLEAVQLAPEERAELIRDGVDDQARTLGLWSRIAAKEAARRLWLAEGAAPVYPADLRIEIDPHGTPILRSLDETAPRRSPALAMAHTEGVAVALATWTPGARIGLAVSRIAAPGEGGETSESEARLACALDAVARAENRPADTRKTTFRVIGLDSTTGAVRLERLAGGRETTGQVLTVATELRGEYVWSWWIAEDSNP